MAAPASDHELIRNAIALNCIAFDTKDWELLRECVAEDCVINYPEPLGPSNGIVAYQQTMKKTIKNAQTQHSVTTQFIQLTSETTAKATTYSQGKHWLDDRTFFAEARYEDKLVKVVSEGTAKWVIQDRTVITMGVPRGDWTLIA